MQILDSHGLQLLHGAVADLALFLGFLLLLNASVDRTRQLPLGFEVGGGVGVGLAQGALFAPLPLPLPPLPLNALFPDAGQVLAFLFLIQNRLVHRENLRLFLLRLFKIHVFHCYSSDDDPLGILGVGLPDWGVLETAETASELHDLALQLANLFQSVHTLLAHH